MGGTLLGTDISQPTVCLKSMIFRTSRSVGVCDRSLEGKLQYHRKKAAEKLPIHEVFRGKKSQLFGNGVNITCIRGFEMIIV